VFNVAKLRPVAILACVVCGCAAFGLAFATWMDLSMNGFPDGHITDYGKAIDTPLTVLAWVETGFGLLFLVLAFLQNGTRARTFGTLVAVLAFALVAIGAEVGVPWYFGTHLGLDNGFGG
jgi:hypothetical protein